MKKIIISFIIILFPIIASAGSVHNFSRLEIDLMTESCPESLICGETNIDAVGYYCPECKAKAEQISENNGVRTIVYKKPVMVFECDPGQVDVGVLDNINTECKLDTEISREYECMSGYFGNPTSSYSGCNVCPENALCPGGDESSMFYCDEGFYKKNGATCENCAYDTGNASATSWGWDDPITGCFIPFNVPQNDTAGTFIYDDICFYEL